MLCLNCLHAEKEVPEDVEELAKDMEKWAEQYPVVIYCAARKVIVVGNPELPTQRVDECNDFAAA